MHNSDKDVTRIAREASAWCVAMNSGAASRQEKARFAEWITRSPAHMREYAEVEALWEEAAAFGPELRSTDGVIALFPGEPRARRRAPERLRALPWRLAAAVLACLAVAAALLATPPVRTALFAPDPPVYATQRGESRVVTLPDGSDIHLNTATRVSVHYTPEERLIRLEAGQAFFDVETDPARPFLVSAETATVEAVGTSFDVRSFDSELSVTVVEGEVVVRSAPESGHAGARDESWQTSLRANQQIRMAMESVARPGPKPVSVSARQATSWRQNMLIFDDRPLSEVVSELNRYNRVRIILLGAGTESVRVSGTFNPRDPGAFASTVSAAAGLDMRTDQTGDIILREMRG